MMGRDLSRKLTRYTPAERSRPWNWYSDEYATFLLSMEFNEAIYLSLADDMVYR